ncbi:hypothetical protein GGI42DRAFT_196187 [Trichoderma sp. SZMC 28013]
MTERKKKRERKLKRPYSKLSSSHAHCHASAASDKDRHSPEPLARRWLAAMENAKKHSTGHTQTQSLTQLAHHSTPIPSHPFPLTPSLTITNLIPVSALLEGCPHNSALEKGDDDALPWMLTLIRVAAQFKTSMYEHVRACHVMYGSMCVHAMPLSLSGYLCLMSLHTVYPIAFLLVSHPIILLATYIQLSILVLGWGGWLHGAHSVSLPKGVSQPRKSYLTSPESRPTSTSPPYAVWSYSTSHGLTRWWQVIVKENQPCDIHTIQYSTDSLLVLLRSLCSTWQQ